MTTLLVWLLLALYGGGMWKFWTGFRSTSFDNTLPNKLSLSVFWPILLLANKSYRQNFQKALQGKK